MKQFFLWVLLVLPTVVFGAPVSIGINSLQESNLSARENVMLTEFIGSLLSEYDQIRVLEDRYIKDVLSEQNFSLSGLSDEESIELGRIIDAEFLLTGTLGRFSAESYFLSLKLLNVAKGATESSIQKRFSNLEEGIRVMPAYLTELFEPVVLLEAREAREDAVSRVVKGAWYYKRNLFSIGPAYSYGTTAFSSSTTNIPATNLHSLGVGISGIIGSRFILIVDSTFTTPLSVTGGSLQFSQDFVNRFILDIAVLPGLRFHLDEKWAFTAGVGLSMRTSFISKTVAFGDMDNTLLSNEYGVGSTLQLEYYVTRNIALRGGFGFTFDFFHLGANRYISDDGAVHEQQFLYGLRLFPKLSVSINQTSLR